MLKPTTILIVDDHPMMRTALRLVLEDQEGLQVIGEAGSVLQGKKKAVELKPDLVLLDLYLPDGSGLEVIQHIRGIIPETRILMVTSSSSEKDIIAAVEAGAISYVVKDSPSEQLVQAVRSVLAGEAFLTPGATDILLKHIRDAEKERDIESSPLSSREKEILQLLARGTANLEISGVLNITESTVRTHFQRIIKKLGLQNYSQLVAYAAKHFN